MLRAKAITLLLVAMLLLPAKSVGAQSFVYLDQDQTFFLFFSPPTFNTFPEMGRYWHWGQQVSLGYPPQISHKLKWRIDIPEPSDPQIPNWVHEAVQDWDGPLPGWIYWQEMQLGQVTNLRIIEETCTFTALGCFVISQWGSYMNAGRNSWVEAVVKINYAASQIDMSPAAKEQVVKHEFGHVVGLHERYPFGGGCNPNEISVMEGLINVGGTAEPCDGTVTPKAIDVSRVTTYYRTGYYARDASNPNDNTWIANGKFYSRWDDYTSTEDVMNMTMQSAPSLSGPWTTFVPLGDLRLRHGTNIGGHLMTGIDLYIEIQPYYTLDQLGAPHGRFIRVCAFPEFGWENGVGPVRGTSTCSSSEWWP